MQGPIDAPTMRQQIQAVRDGEQSPTNLVEAALDRLEATEQLQAFTWVAADRARAEARALDRDAAEGCWRGPLHGIPIAVKDLFDVEGEVTGAGSLVPPSGVAAGRDANAVRAMRRAGAVVIGRTRTHEYAWGMTTQHPVLGGTRNPHDASRVPGGSSGGSAAAVAAGVVTLALGTDTAGSIRLPAAWCGLVGFKPTHGRASLDGVVPLAPTFDHVGVLVRTVEDARIGLAVLLGESLRIREGTKLTGLRIGMPVGPATPTCDDTVAAVMRSTASIAEGAGASVIATSGPSWVRMRDTFFALQASEAVAYHRSLGHWPESADRYGDDVRERLRRADMLSAHDIATAREDLRALRAEISETFTVVDLLLQPVAGSGPSTVTSPDVVLVNGVVDDLRNQVLPHTLLASMCGLPACSVPVGDDGDGLPIGIQVVGPAGADELVLAVADAIVRLMRRDDPSALGERSVLA